MPAERERSQLRADLDRIDAWLAPGADAGWLARDGLRFARIHTAQHLQIVDDIRAACALAPRAPEDLAA